MGGLGKGKRLCLSPTLWSSRSKTFVSSKKSFICFLESITEEGVLVDAPTQKCGICGSRGRAYLAVQSCPNLTKPTPRKLCRQSANFVEAGEQSNASQRLLRAWWAASVLNSIKSYNGPFHLSAILVSWVWKKKGVKTATKTVLKLRVRTAAGARERCFALLLDQVRSLQPPTFKKWNWPEEDVWGQRYEKGRRKDQERVRHIISNYVESQRDCICHD